MTHYSIYHGPMRWVSGHQFLGVAPLRTFLHAQPDGSKPAYGSLGEPFYQAGNEGLGRLIPLDTPYVL